MEREEWGGGRRERSEEGGGKIKAEGGGGGGRSRGRWRGGSGREESVNEERRNRIHNSLTYFDCSPHGL